MTLAEPTTDIWAQWLLHRRHGGDPQRLRATVEYLYPVWDRVLANARLRKDGTLLDVGCGDGLIAFGALQRHQESKVIFSDISQDLGIRRSADHGDRREDRGGLSAPPTAR
jgi:methylase of polypeptide subunit release factors